MKQQTLYLFLLSLSLCSCAFFSSHTTSSSGQTHLPKVPPAAIPGGVHDNWRYIGTTDDGMLVIEINNNSISSALTKDNLQVFNFQDRKTVVSPGQFTYPANQPHFKYLINDWQIDCQNKKYIVLDATMYSQSGTQIGHYDYKNDDSVKWIKFGSGSIADLEYKFVCQNQNRNLGY